MKNATALAIGTAALTMLGIGGAIAQGPPEWKEVRIATLGSWHGPAMNMVVRSYTLLEDPPYQAFGNFIGAADVVFTGQTATDFEIGINKNGLSFLSDTILPPGTVIHLDPLDYLSVPNCGDVADMTTETCRTINIFRTVPIFVR